MNSRFYYSLLADFDGDEMNAIVLKTVEAEAETKLVSSVNNWFVSYQTSSPVIGLIQDGVIGAFEMTRDHSKNIDKFHAMQMMNRVTTDIPFEFTKKTYHSRELLSMVLPKINFVGKPSFYVPEFKEYIKYSDTETKIVIKNGEIESGVLDKATLSKGATGGIFHTIYIEHGPNRALECMYNWQQMFCTFLYYRGATFGFNEVYITPKARELIQAETNKIISASHEVDEQLARGELIPPVEMTLEEYYEEMQSAALDHGDEFLKIILSQIDTDRNWLFKYIFSGSKGSRTNLTAIYSNIGSIAIKGKRIPFLLDGRTSINYPRYSVDPISRGYCPDSFSSGIRVQSYVFSSQEARHEIIEIALSTAMAGTLNRNAIKNFEGVVVGNTRCSIKYNRPVQFLFGETGVDPRKVIKVTFPTIKISDADFTKEFRATPKMFAKAYQHKKTEELCSREFEQLRADRDEFRNIMFQLERNSKGAFIIT